MRNAAPSRKPSFGILDFRNQGLGSLVRSFAAKHDFRGWPKGKAEGMKHDLGTPRIFFEKPGKGGEQVVGGFEVFLVSRDLVQAEQVEGHD